MIDKISISHFKSIESLELSLGRVNVFIGENGAGKSNILEAIAFGSAAFAAKLDNEFLGSRGIRTTAARFMKSAFDGRKSTQPIKIQMICEDASIFSSSIQAKGDLYPEWMSSIDIKVSDNSATDVITSSIKNYISQMEPTAEARALLEKLRKSLESALKNYDAAQSDKIEVIFEPGFIETFINQKTISHPDLDDISQFLIYSPENTALRSRDSESQIKPLGVHGEGLLDFLAFLHSNKNSSEFKEISDNLKMFSWLKSMKFSRKKSESSLIISDNFISSYFENIDYRSTNEAFLFAAFYFSLFSSKLTPKIFAIDNIDVALNPRLCEEMMVRLIALAKRFDKQVLLTTHNPAILDGIDLGDPDQRLFVVSRGPRGRTRVRRVQTKEPNKPARLSQLFIDGLLGGLPTNF